MAEDKHSDHGLWSKEGVPQKGWVCIDRIDMEEQTHICEMCLHAEVRFVQVMSHPKYSGNLKCGKVCAGRMENEYAAEQREREMRSEADKRERWVNSPRWKMSND